MRYPTTERNVSSSHLLAVLFTQPLLETEKLMSTTYLQQYEFAMFFPHKTAGMHETIYLSDSNIQTFLCFFFLRVMKRAGHLRTGGELSTCDDGWERHFTIDWKGKESWYAWNFSF